MNLGQSILCGLAILATAYQLFQMAMIAALTMHHGRVIITYMFYVGAITSVLIQLMFILSLTGFKGV